MPSRLGIREVVRAHIEHVRTLHGWTSYRLPCTYFFPFDTAGGGAMLYHHAFRSFTSAAGHHNGKLISVSSLSNLVYCTPLLSLLSFRNATVYSYLGSTIWPRQSATTTQRAESTSLASIFRWLSVGTPKVKHGWLCGGCCVGVLQGNKWPN